MENLINLSSIGININKYQYPRPTGWTNQEFRSLIASSETNSGWFVGQDHMIDLIRRLGPSIDVHGTSWKTAWVEFNDMILDFHDERGVFGVDLRQTIRQLGTNSQFQIVFTHPADRVKCSFVPAFGDEGRGKPVCICMVESTSEYPEFVESVDNITWDGRIHDVDGVMSKYDVAMSNFILEFAKHRSDNPVILDV